jgi:hypothetical protein
MRRRILTLSCFTVVVVVLCGPAAGARTITWSGRSWDVKDSGAGVVGPGPNRFSDSARTVWVDGRGRLHLRIEFRHGHWYSAEVVATEATGYGTYDWRVVGRAADLDPNVVLGLFTWDEASGDHHREIDIEWSRWGRRRGTNAGFTVQPYTHDGNGHAFDIRRGAGARLTQAFDWGADQVRFWSILGHRPPPATGWVDERWTYRGPDVPPEGEAHARINLWLFRGDAPTDGADVEIVLRAFTFTPDGLTASIP